MALTFGSLFAGIGGIDLGFERAGMQCKWQVEIDEYARQVLAKHWPDVRRWDDVRSWPQPDTERVDVICGGDPCQSNSNANSVHKSERESVACQFLRIVGTIRPRFVVRENPATIRKDAPWPWWRFREGLEQLGYGVVPFRARACCFGASHKRERLFLLAELPDANSERLEGINRKGFEARNDGRESGNQFRNAWQDCLPKPVFLRGRNGIPNQVDRIRGLGNAVVPQIAEWIGRRIIEAFEN
jgi:DNA (cytosine-5)-methyltransferase 1